MSRPILDVSYRLISSVPFQYLRDKYCPIATKYLINLLTFLHLVPVQYIKSKPKDEVVQTSSSLMSKARMDNKCAAHPNMQQVCSSSLMSKTSVDTSTRTISNKPCSNTHAEYVNIQLRSHLDLVRCLDRYFAQKLYSTL